MQGDINALIYKNKGLVYQQLHKFHLAQDPEAESIGYEALYNAILDYDCDRGTALSTVASVYIYNALGSYVRHLNRQRQIQTISYNNIMSTDGETECEYLELLSLETSTEKEFIQKELQIIVRDIFDKQYAKLTNEKHKAIVELWQESEFTTTTVDISKVVGVSQSYVSQVINNFKATLRKKMEEHYYD